jgi:hypothetical protein
MQLITVGSVADAVKRALDGVSERPTVALDSTFFLDQGSRPLGRVTRGAL